MSEAVTSMSSEQSYLENRRGHVCNLWQKVLDSQWPQKEASDSSLSYGTTVSRGS